MTHLFPKQETALAHILLCVHVDENFPNQSLWIRAFQHLAPELLNLSGFLMYGFDLYSHDVADKWEDSESILLLELI